MGAGSGCETGGTKTVVGARFFGLNSRKTIMGTRR